MLAVLFCLVAPAVASAADDYPAGCANVSGENCRAAPRDTYTDRWGFYSRECTSFVAWRMNRDGGAGSFTNRMRGGWFSDAYHWADNAAAIGFHVNSTPAVGAIAQWKASEGIAGPYGHVAYVAAVAGDGSVTIEDYNSDPHDPGTEPGWVSRRPF